MYTKNSLIMQTYSRQHERHKSERKQERVLRWQRCFEFMVRHTEPLIAGLAGTSYIGLLSESQIAAQRANNVIFKSMSRSNIFTNCFQGIGWGIIQLFKMFLDAANAVLDNVYSMFSFFTSSGVNGYVSNLMGFLWIPCIISLLILGYQLILNSKNRPDVNKVLQNALIIIILVTGLPALMSTVGHMTKTFVTADFNSRGENTSNEIIANHLVDYEYLYDWINQKFPNDYYLENNNFSALHNYTYLSSIDINEVMRYDNAANLGENNDAWDNRDMDHLCWLCTVVTTGKRGLQAEHIDNPAWWDFFSDTYYYRYKMDYLGCIVSLVALTVVIILSAIKVCRILWELAVYRVLALFFAMADLHNGEKLKEIIKAIAGGFIVIAVNTILIKFYMIFDAWVTDPAQKFDTLTKIIMLISVAIAVIDGPNLVQKLIGVNSGIRSAASTIGAMYVAGKAVSGAGKSVKKINKGAKEIGEFGRDVGSKAGAIGGFAAGAGVNAVQSIKERSAVPKDERKAARQQDKADYKQEKAGNKAEQQKTAENEAINQQVAANAPARMATESGYTSDSIESYKDAAGTIQAYNGKTDDQLTDMAEDAYLSTHGDQLMTEAAELQDEATANGTEMSDKDAMTAAYASKHSNSAAVTPDGTYRSAGQRHKNKIDSLHQSQKHKGKTILDARLDRYGKIGRQAKSISKSDGFKDKQEVDSHIAAAAQAHGRTYTPGSTAESIDVYQGNMSAALAHKDEIMTHAREYMEEEKQAGHKNISMDDAISHVVANEQDYDMGYGFSEEYAPDIAEALVGEEQRQKAFQAASSNKSDPSRKSLQSNSTLNQSLGREKESHNKPKQSVVHSTKKGYQAGRNLFHRNNKK